MSSSTLELPPDLKSRQKASYDAIARIYNDWTDQHNPLRLRFLDQLCTVCPQLLDSSQTPALLELGCGRGTPTLDTMLARNSGLSVVANDMSEIQIGHAKENLAAYADRAKCIAGDMTKLEFPDDSFTAVIALYTFLHLPREEQVEMFRKIAQWLKPGGYLLCNFANEEIAGRVNDKWLHEEGWMYESGYGAEESARKLEEAGFEVEHQSAEGDEMETFVWFIVKKK
ncbi:hypothetical protein K4F52_005253 [Lecanicillium sp. MT-2017a]|nr:hypothetical protein K4F52_005253 [Lecanicillium sp. MT-2017a]